MNIDNVTRYDIVYDHLCSCGANQRVREDPIGAFVLFEEAKEASLNSHQQPAGRNLREHPLRLL